MTEETKDSPPGTGQGGEQERGPVDRRALILAALTAAAVAGTAKPKEAEAQLGGLLGDIPGLGDLFEFLFEILSAQAQFEIPPAAMRVIDQVIAIINGGAGADSLLRVGTIEGAIENSFPAELINTPVDHVRKALDQAEARIKRAKEGAGICAAVAESQAEIAVEETKLVTVAQNTPILPDIMRCQTALLGTICARLGHISMQLAGLTEVNADHILAQASDTRQGAMETEFYIGGDGASVSPPLRRPVR